MRSREEINRMCTRAHERQKDEFWRGVKYALFWVLEAIDDMEVVL